MSSQRPSFAKRDREMKLKDKARAKEQRRIARRSEVRTGQGPPIATFEEVDLMRPSADTGPDVAAAPTSSPAPGPSR